MSTPSYSVNPHMWDDEDFLALSDGARTLWNLLLTGPQRTVLPGLQRAGIASLAEALRRPVEAVEVWFSELVSRGMVIHDASKRVVWTPKAPKHNEAQSPNHIRAWWRRWIEIPDCYPKWGHVEQLREHARLEVDRHASAWAETFGTIEDRCTVECSRSTDQALPESPVGARAPLRPRPGAADADQDPQEGSSLLMIPSPPPGSSKPATARARDSKPDAGEIGMSASDLAVRDAVLLDPDLAKIVHRPNALAIDLVVNGPGLDVPAQVRGAGAWLRANPARRKSNGNQFLLSWIRRAQDGASQRGQATRADKRNRYGRPMQGDGDFDDPMFHGGE